MVDMTQLQAMYGGTFDPVHYGHLKPVEILANLIGLNKVTIVPNNVPPHRPQPEATSEHTTTAKIHFFIILPFTFFMV